MADLVPILVAATSMGVPIRAVQISLSTSISMRTGVSLGGDATESECEFVVFNSDEVQLTVVG